jgi:hypothetical protein
MNDLLKAAQAVLDVWDKLDNGKWETEGDFHNLDCQYREALDTLRQAVEQAKGVEAVDGFRVLNGHMVVDGHCISIKDGRIVGVSAITTPPSVGALIAEAVAKEREACAQISEDFDKERPQSNYGRCIAVAIRARSKA